MKVVILGGGYSGVWAYRAVKRWLGSKAEITVVSDYNFHSFHGFTGDAISGDLDVKLVRSPLEECFPQATRVLGKAVHIDEAGQRVTVETKGNHEVLAYDHLVVATGAKERTDHIEGISDHGWHLRHPDTLPKLIDHAEQFVATHADEAGRTVVVIGNGFTGTEVSAALQARLGARGKVLLVTSSDRLIPHWARREVIQQNLRKHLSNSKVEVKIGRVASVTPDSVLLTDGTVIGARTIINASGNVPVVPAGLEHRLDESGMLIVNSHLRVSEHIWAAGDAAATRNLRGELVIKDALWATATGTKAGRNIARVARRAKPSDFRFIGFGEVATFARGRSVGLLYGVPLLGWIGYAARQSVFLWFVPSRSNALRVARAFSIGTRAN